MTEQAEDAVRTLIRYIGDDPDRPELAATPKRVAALLRHAFAGYGVDPAAALGNKLPLLPEQPPIPVHFDGIAFQSYCEHHLVPFTGTVRLAYVPQSGYVGIGGVLRLVRVCAARLQLQENLTVMLAESMHKGADAAGVAVSVQAVHRCTSIEALLHPEATVTTYHYTGVYADNAELRSSFIK